jgi:hypothetical protein
VRSFAARLLFDLASDGRSSFTAKLIQLIALTGPAGAWRKTLTDAIFACVRQSAVHRLPP